MCDFCEDPKCNQCGKYEILKLDGDLVIVFSGSLRDPTILKKYLEQDQNFKLYLSNDHPNYKLDMSYQGLYVTIKNFGCEDKFDQLFVHFISQLNQKGFSLTNINILKRSLEASNDEEQNEIKQLPSQRAKKQKVKRSSNNKKQKTEQSSKRAKKNKVYPVHVGQYKNKKAAKGPKGYKNIIVHTTGLLSPLVVKVKDEVTGEEGIFENWWQLKVYPKVPEMNQPISQFHKIEDFGPRWAHPAEVHAVKNADGSFKIKKKYYAWRRKLIRNPRWVRYPVGRSKARRASCIGALAKIGDECYLVDYISARKLLYFNKYYQAIKDTQEFIELKKDYDAGAKIQICEVDAPEFIEGDPIYGSSKITKDKTGLSTTCIKSKKDILDFINNPKQPFGHGLCLAAYLLGITDMSDQVDPSTFITKVELPNFVKINKKK